MQFLISDNVYIGGVYLPADPANPRVISLPDDSTDFSVHKTWQPLDAVAQKAQVDHVARDFDMTPDDRRSHESTAIDDKGKASKVRIWDETEREHAERNKHRMFPRGWKGYPIARRPEGVPVIDPSQIDAPVGGISPSNPLGA